MQIGDSPTLGPVRLAARRLRQHLHLRAARRRRARSTRCSSRTTRQPADARDGQARRTGRTAPERPGDRGHAGRRLAGRRRRRRDSALVARVRSSALEAPAPRLDGDDPQPLRRRREAPRTGSTACSAGAQLRRTRPAAGRRRPSSNAARLPGRAPTTSTCTTAHRRAGDRRHRARPRRPGRRHAAARAAKRDMLFQIRPAGVGAPLIDPKPILDGWVALENSSIFRAKGENPFLATSPTVGQVLLESKEQLEQQVLREPRHHICPCGRQDIQTGQIDKRVLATLEFLSVSGLKPTVSALKCGHSDLTAAGNAPSTRPATPSTSPRSTASRSPGTRGPARSPTRRSASC